MRRTDILGLAAAVALLAGCAGPLTYGDRDESTRYGYGERNFSGTWQIDPSRSDNPQTYRNTDDRSRNQDSDRDEDNNDSYRDRNARFRSAWNDMGRMPDVIRIDGRRGQWTIRDTNGGVVEQIAMQDRDQDYGDNGDVAIGQWRSGQLVVERDRNGRGYTQTFTLQDRGRVLMVRTDVAGPNGSRSYARVYDRVS